MTKFEWKSTLPSKTNSGRSSKFKPSSQSLKKQGPGNQFHTPFKIQTSVQNHKKKQLAKNAKTKIF